MKNEVTGLKNHVDKVTGSIGNSFKSIRNIVAGLGIASLIKSTILGNVDAAIKRVDTLSNYSRVMSNLGVGSVQANASVQKLSNKLIGLPTTLDDASGAVQRFTSVNSNISRSTDMFLALNNAILAGGASSEIQKSALEQLSQSYAKGKPDMFEWRSAMTAMPAQMKQVAEAMGFVNASALGEALRNGTVSMDQFMDTIMKLNTQGINGYQSFEEQARNATGGIATSIANMRTAIVRCMSDVMNTIGQSNIAGFFTNIAKAINSCVPYVVVFTKVVMVAVGYLTALFGGKSKKLSSSFGGVSNNAKKAAGNTGALAKKMNDASDSSQKLSKGASGTGRGLKKAAGNASKLKKELKGALAGFDAINNINSSNGSSDPSSGGSGGVGGSGGDIGGFSMDDSGAEEQKGLLEEVDKQLEEIKKKVAEFFQPLKQSWDKFGAPMIAAAVYAFNGVKNLLMEIGKSMYTVWENGTGAKTVELILKIFTNIFKIIGNISQGLADAWNTAGLGDSIIQHLWNIFNSILKIINEILKIVRDITKAIDWTVVLGAVNVVLGIIDGLFSFIADNVGLILGILSAIAGLSLFSTLAGILGTVITQIQLAVGVFSGWASLATALSGAFGILPQIFASIVMAVNPVNVIIGAVIATVVDLWQKSKSFRDDIVSILGNIATIVQKVFLNIVAPIIDTVGKIIMDFVETVLKPLWNAWENVFQSIMGLLSDFLKFATPIFSTILDILGPIFKLALTLLRGVFDMVFAAIRGIIERADKTICERVNNIREFFRNLGEWMEGTFGFKWKNVFETVKNAVKAFRDCMGPIISSVQVIFMGLTNFISGVFSGNWRRAWFGVRQIFESIVSGLSHIFKAPLNFMIDGINKFLSGIGKIKIPDWVPGVGGKGFSIPRIPRLAKGGIVSASTIANIGEAGTEAVIPLQRNTQGLDMIAEKISERLSLPQNDGTGATYVIKLVLDDGRVITKMVIDNIKDYEARTGKPVFDY
ncbi:tape measure protein [uncultured Catenibacterium sp.]|uniref:tape measure protein n=1 Tax=uncultured Catenibacterium sp. TaxID=286142 RepID=UPI0025943EC4|nr:tape measure protein [uncultured Catenibacterium sp.]